MLLDRPKRLLASVCGGYCGECAEYIGQRCRGCGYELGLTPHGECALFQCCIAENGLEHCGMCGPSPCPLFQDAFGRDIASRRWAALRARFELGTDLWLDRQTER